MSLFSRLFAETLKQLVMELVEFVSEFDCLEHSLLIAADKGCKSMQLGGNIEGLNIILNGIEKVFTIDKTAEEATKYMSRLATLSYLTYGNTYKEQLTFIKHLDDGRKTDCANEINESDLLEALELVSFVGDALKRLHDNFIQKKGIPLDEWYEILDLMGDSASQYDDFGMEDELLKILGVLPFDDDSKE